MDGREQDGTEVAKKIKVAEEKRTKEPNIVEHQRLHSGTLGSGVV